MKNLLSALPVIVLVLLLFCPVTLLLATAASRPEPLHVQSVQADFIQEKHLKILARPIISTGTFAFQAPRSLRWEYRTAIPSILLMHDGKVTKFIQRDGKFVEDKGMGLDSMQVVLGQIASWLDGRFTDNDMFSVAFSDPRTILLTPKTEALAGLISRIELRLAAEKGLLDKVTIYEGPGSYTQMTFTNRVLNRQIPDSVFTKR
jgi:outer membrane lipoprotein-sorting protein